ncbi:Uncharacterised protein [Vibrio cholerae]|nr:Uncharacterised protein [Vibrio cholerae]CSB89946.1 Uncharacterised protein [Vibrio cholerae]CSC96238.1 Uncharacterised protein [Vibrio cholerae]
MKLKSWYSVFVSHKRFINGWIGVMRCLASKKQSSLFKPHDLIGLKPKLMDLAYLNDKRKP